MTNDFADGLPLFDQRMEWEAVQRELEARALGDGLPLVPPTRARLEAMLAGVTDRERSGARLPPLLGEVRPDTVAYQCVLAGCPPPALPVVLAAAAACAEPEFNLLGLLTTTGSPAVALIVHPPLAARLGFNAATNCLGPGARMNATVGRALSLVLRNIAGAREGVGDMATLGQPGKYTFCFAEAPDRDFPSLAARRGIDGEAVSVLGVSGTLEVLPQGGAATAEQILRPVADAMAAATAAAGGGQQPAPGEQVFLLPPELAATLAGRGWDLPRVQAFVFDTAAGDGGAPVAPAPEAIEPIVTGGPGVKMSYLPLWAGGTAIVSRQLADP